MHGFTTRAEVQLPLVIQLNGMTADAFVSYYEAKKDHIEQKLLQCGAVKFTGVQIDSLPTFEGIVNAISSRFLNYIDGNSPRTKLSGKVYTSTEYDNTQKITMHNELSYSAKWPNRLFFSCLQPAQSGGATLLADSREILENMDEDIVSEIQEKGITYIRNLHGEQGVGPSWQDTFETSDKQQVEAYCRAYFIHFEWRDKNRLRLKQSGRGIIEHRITGEKLWFNQIDQFHPCQLGPEMLDTMRMIYDTPEDFPMYVRFGDGSKISESFVQEILRTIDEVTIAPPWQQNELLIVDNELAAHGRAPFSGDRKVLVAMSE